MIYNNEYSFASSNCNNLSLFVSKSEQKTAYESVVVVTDLQVIHLSFSSGHAPMCPVESENPVQQDGTVCVGHIGSKQRQLLQSTQVHVCCVVTLISLAHEGA